MKKLLFILTLITSFNSNAQQKTISINRNDLAKFLCKEVYLNVDTDACESHIMNCVNMILSRKPWGTDLTSEMYFSVYAQCISR